MPISTAQEISLPGYMISYPHGTDDGHYCLENTRMLNRVLSHVRDKGFIHYSSLLKDFAHSASCSQVDCSAVCLMFRRVRQHIARPRPAVSSNNIVKGKRCFLFTLYSILLRQHVSICKVLNCGFPACPSLRQKLLQRDLDVSTGSGCVEAEMEILYNKK